MGAESQLRRKHFTWSIICISSTLVLSTSEIVLMTWATNAPLTTLLSLLGLIVSLPVLSLALTYRTRISEKGYLARKEEE
jgi:hypothetical protein